MMTVLRVIPVLDVKQGRVVRGVGGRREDYRTVISVLTASSWPADVAQAIHDCLGLTELYLADLDAIGGLDPAWPVYQALRSRGYRLWVDAGVRAPGDVSRLGGAGDVIVVGLETASGPRTLAAACQELGTERVAFSLDLHAGRPLGELSAWGKTDPLDIAIRAIEAGVRRLIVLDLAHVGSSQGTGTGELCRRIREDFPGVELLAGGGIRGREDLLHLQKNGVSAALVASALHDGRLRADDLRGL